MQSKLLPDKYLTLDALVNKVIESYNEVKKNKPSNIALFLGAGCSISSNVIAGKGIIDLCQKIAFVNDCANGYEVEDKFNEISLNNFIDKYSSQFEQFIQQKNELFKYKISTEPTKSSLLATIPHELKYSKNESEAWDSFKELLFEDTKYGNWFETYSQNIYDRQKLIEFLIDDKTPSGVYIFLAYLISKGVFKNIFTTNFDDLLNDALIHYTNQKAKVYAHNEIAKYIDFNSTKPNIIKLHGDYFFQNIKNTIEDTSVLEGNMDEKLSDALSKFKLNVIILGYGGNDSSIMNTLLKVKKEYSFGLYWCARKDDNLHWRVKHLINSTSNSFFVKISSFEQFIAKINNIVKPVNEFYSVIDTLAAQRNSEREKFFNEYIEEINNDPEISAAEKQNFKDSLSIKLTDHSFIYVDNLPSLKEKVEYLKQLRIDGISRIIKNIHTNINKNSAKEIYHSLFENEKLFQIKVQEAPIQHTSNALCNLTYVDDIFTKKLFNSVENKYFIEKFKLANPGEVMSALNELSSIDSAKSTEIGKHVAPNKIDDINKISIREFTKPFTKSNRFKAIEILDTYPDKSLAERLTKETLKEISIAIEAIYSVSPNKASKVLQEISNEILLAKTHESTLLNISNALIKFNAINTHKAKFIFKTISRDTLISKIEKSSIRDIAIAFAELQKVDRDKIHSIFIETSDTVFSKKIEENTFIEIAHSLIKLKNLNHKKTGFILKKTKKEIILEKLNSDKSRFEEIGAAFLNLYSIDPLFADLIQKSNVITKAKEYSKDCIRMGEQAFMTYFPALIEIHPSLASLMLKEFNNDFFISLTAWSGLENYTTSLLKIFRLAVIEKLNDPAKITGSFICFNSKMLQARYNDAEIEQIKKEINPYSKCV